jgi:DNA-binding MarR family transcriptional regulator
MSHRGPFILVFALDQQLSTVLAKAMADAPISPDVFAVTSVLRLIQPARPTVLAQTIGMRPTTLSNYLRRLEESGLIRRRRDPADGRASLLRLTAKGTRQTEACFPGFARALDTFDRNAKAEGLKPTELLSTLEAMSRALDATLAELDEQGAQRARATRPSSQTASVDS